MNKELVAYFRLQAIIAAAYNFFISGMISGLIYHKVDFVKADTISIAIDITITCLLTFFISTPFSRASLRRDKIEGIFTVKTPLARLLAWLYRYPVLLCVVLSLCTSLILSVLTAMFLSLLGVNAVPFYSYVAFKSVLCAVLGTFATCVVLYAGMCRQN